MKKICVFLTMFSLLLCTACSGKNNNASDYAQNNAQYGTLIDRTRMSVGLNDQRLGNRNYVIQPDGSLWTWGIAVDRYNSSGYSESNLTPSAMKLMDDVANYSADMYNLLAVKNDGSLWSWELDWPDASIGYPRYDGPTRIMDNVVDVSNNGRTIMAIDSNGGLWSWGLNGYGQLGDGTTEDRYEPAKIMDDVVSVCNGGGYAMAVKSDGSLWGWGINSFGQLGDGTKENRYKPVKIMKDVVAVDCDGGISMALCEDGSLWGWGSYGNFEATYNNIIAHAQFDEDKYFKRVKVFDDVIDFSINGDLGVIMAVKSDGSLWGWGSNLYGQLANSDNKFSAEPVHIMDDIVYVSVFEDQYVMAVGNDDSVWFWGKESNINDDSFLSTPIRIDLSNLPDNSDEPDWMIVGNSNDWGIAGCPPTWYIETTGSDYLEVGVSAMFYHKIIISEDRRENMKVGIIEETAENDTLLDMIFGDNDYSSGWSYESFDFNDGNTGIMLKNPQNNWLMWVNGSAIMSFYYTDNPNYDKGMVLDVARTLCDRNRDNAGLLMALDRQLTESGSSTTGDNEILGIDTLDEKSMENLEVGESVQDGEDTITFDDTAAGFSKPLEYYFELSGSYKSSSGQSTLSISIYSSEEETGIGTVWVDTEMESYYLGEIIAELEENVYLAETDMGEETVLYVYYIYPEDYETIYIDLNVDGQYIGGYTMVEHYES